MKLLLITFFSCFVLSVNGQVQADALGFVHPKIIPTHNVHYIDNVSQFPSFYNGHGIDTFVVRIPVINGGVDFGQDTGVTIINGVDVVVINGGIRWANIQDCNLIGWGSDSAYGFRMVGGGTGGSFDGMQKHNKFMGGRYTGASQGGVWAKQDPNNACQFPNYYNQFAPDPNNPSKDTSKYKYANVYQYLYAGNKPYDSIWFIHNKVDRCGGEGIYFGSTDYILSNGQWERLVPCLGNAALAPTQLQNCRADSNDVDTTGRTGIQMSQATSGTNSINYNHIRNTGYEYLVTHDQGALSQGAAVRVGWAWNQQPSRLMNVIGNFGDTSLIYFLDIAEASNVQYNYFGTHFGQVYYNGTSVINPQQNPSGRFFAQNKATSIEQIKYNTLLSTTGANGAVTYGVYGGVNFLPANEVCGNNVAISVLATPYDYKTVCNNYDTTYKDTTVFIQHDSLVNFHFDSTFRDSIGKVFVPTKPVTSVYKNRHWHVHYVGDSVDVTYRVLVRAAYDSVGYCNLCAAHDTAYRIPIIPQTGWGGFILNGYNGLNTLSSRINYNKQTLLCKYMRENFNFGQTYSNKQFLDSGITPLMTYSPTNAAMPNPFPDLSAQLTKTFDSLLTISSPKGVAYINEMATIQFNDSTGGGTFTANKYLSTFNPMCTIAHNHQILFCDGGITFPIIYQMADYYTRINRLDSVAYLTSVTGIVNFTNAPQKIYWRDFYNTLLPGIRASNADYAQVHWYEPITSDTSITTTSGLLTVVLNYVQNQTGKRVISLETGTDNFSQPLFNGMFTEWTKYGAAYITYFLANASGAGNAIPNPTYFIQFKTNNP